MEEKISIKKSPSQIPGLYTVTLIILSHLEKWWPWMIYQANKQIDYIIKKGLDYQLIITVPYRLSEKAIKYFSQINCEILVVEDDDKIGTIRNKAVKKSLGYITAFQDQDDWYAEYRLHYMWTKLVMTKYNIFTIDKFLSYNIQNDKFYNNEISSESCLMFKTHITKSNKFGNTQKGEGDEFTKGMSILLEDEVVLMVATDHLKNTTFRSGTITDKYKKSEIYNDKELELLNCVIVK